jgi:hypothetical protein
LALAASGNIVKSAWAEPFLWEEIKLGRKTSDSAVAGIDEGTSRYSIELTTS